MLQTIYKVRLRLFRYSLAVLFLWVFVYTYRGLDINDGKSFAKEDTLYLTAGQMQYVNVLLLELPILTISYFIFRKRIRPYRKDIKTGYKILVPYIVQRKQYFPHTDQYFLSFNDPDYMHHEVDAMTYSLCSEGQTVYLKKAPYSGYIFEQNGRFTIM